ncbi:hypothetical protein BH09PSE2_BH09PSE2_12570 [soil metagenome]
MNFVVRFGLISCAALLSTACASINTAQREARIELAAPTPSGEKAELYGQTSFVWGDAWTATNLFERAAAQDASPLNRLNLATGYERTGRIADAMVIYRELAVGDVRDRAVALSERDTPTRRTRGYSIAEEAARRSTPFAEWLAYARAKEQHRPNVFLASSGGAALTPPTSGGVSDSLARQFDARDARTPEAGSQ